MRIDGASVDVIEATDRGLQYGDGLFETIAVLQGKPQLWSRHMDRLRAGCRRLALPLPSSDLLLQEATEEIGLADRAVLKILITRGSGGRGYRPPSIAAMRRIVAVYPWPAYPSSYWTDGVCLRYCRTPLGMNAALAGMKHLNRLEQVLARAEWTDPDIAEGLMLDTSGNLIEGTMSNLFLWRRGELLTPELSRCGVAGVMRGFVLDKASALGLKTRIERLLPSDLEQAEAVFLSNSVVGIWPVRRIEERAYATTAIPAALTQAALEVSCA
jgi:4-amino-4-deoxychorismate lyase